jgi:hypothetical protein
MSFTSRLGLCAAAYLLTTSAAGAQPAPDAPPALTAADYERAEKFMTYNTTPLVLRSGVRASWLPGDPSDRFWYRVTTERVEVVLVDPERGQVGLRPAAQGGGARGSRARRGGDSARTELSPDRKRTAFISRTSGCATRQRPQTQLTRDGVKDWLRDRQRRLGTHRAILRWSPTRRRSPRSSRISAA